MSIRSYSVHELETISVDSVWKKNIEISENSSQTESVKLSTTSTQCPDKSDAEILVKPEKRLKEEEEMVKFNSTNLHKFLNHAADIVIKEIDESINFTRNSLPLIVDTNNETRQDFHLVRTFNSDHLASVIDDYQLFNCLSISAVEWNHSQTSLIITYKYKNHSNWCVHKSYLTVWNLFYVKKSSEKPCHVLQIDGCPTAIKSHPVLNTIYAIGLFSGKMAIFDSKRLDWDVVIDSNSIINSNNDYELPAESIVGVEWLKRSSTNSDYLNLVVTFSQDGFIIRWQFDYKSSQLTIIDISSIYLIDLPKSLAIKNDSPNPIEVCLSSFTFEPEDETNFIVGCEGGAIFLCSLSGSTRINGRTFKARSNNSKLAAIKEKNPIIMSYAPHRARVNCLDFGKNLRNLFLSTGLDQELRIWNLLQNKPLNVLHCDTNLIVERWLWGSAKIVGIEENGLICCHQIKEKERILLCKRFCLPDRNLANYLWINKHTNCDQIAVVSGDCHQVYLGELN